MSLDHSTNLFELFYHVVFCKYCQITLNDSKNLSKTFGLIANSSNKNMNSCDPDEQTFGHIIKQKFNFELANLSLPFQLLVGCSQFCDFR